ncbi:MAG TPA: tetratricopeptide repeat protein, partial [Streptosporangiaceae bacterium]
GRGTEAVQWWQRAARAGHPQAMRTLGILLQLAGRDAEAQTWFERARQTTVGPNGQPPHPG